MTSLHIGLPPGAICFDSSATIDVPHSFPTRRSSDLSDHAGAEFVEDLERRLVAVRAKLTLELDGVPDPPRSEEHTSELQSRLHLVCRLLLGKKNRSRRSSHSPSCTCASARGPCARWS